MLKADSRTLKSDSEVQSSAAPPRIPSAVACRSISRTVWTIDEIELPGNARFSSVTR